jgi:hypothetical protein
MNAIYISMEKSRETFSLPTSLEVEGKNVALLEISGRVSPATQKHLFLCCNFADSSMLTSGKQLPVLRRFKASRFSKGVGGKVEQAYRKLLWIPTNRSPISEISIYICDEHGNEAPFQTCILNCTLVFSSNPLTENLTL